MTARPINVPLDCAMTLESFDATEAAAAVVAVAMLAVTVIDEPTVERVMSDSLTLAVFAKLVV